MATEIEIPDVKECPTGRSKGHCGRLSLANSDAKEIWDLKLEDAVKFTLENSKVIRQLGGAVRGRRPPDPATRRGDHDLRSGDGREQRPRRRRGGPGGIRRPVEQLPLLGEEPHPAERVAARWRASPSWISRTRPPSSRRRFRNFGHGRHLHGDEHDRLRLQNDAAGRFPPTGRRTSRFKFASRCCRGRASSSTASPVRTARPAFTTA